MPAVYEYCELGYTHILLSTNYTVGKYAFSDKAIVTFFISE